MLCHLTRRNFLTFASGAAVAGLIPAAQAAQLASPEGKTILRIGGKIAVRNAGDEAVFDVKMLDSLGTTSFKTATPWTDGVATWEGVPLSVLIDTVGASGTTIRATALNDYVVDMPMTGLAEEGAIIAMRRDGELMPISNKGPLFILYPFDGHPNLQQQIYYMRCAWQIARLDIL